MKTWVREILKWCAALAPSVAAAALGAWIGRDIPNGAVWHYVLFAFQLICIIVSPLLSFVWGKKLEKLKVRERLEIADARKQAMDRDERKERRRLELACGFTICYLAALTAAALGCSFFCGASGVGIGSTQLISVYILYGIMGRLIHRHEKADHSQALSRAEFPQLYRMAEEAAGTAAGQGKIYIYLLDNVPHDECNVGVTQRGKDTLLAMGTTLLCTLERDEMLQVLRHEFAHIEHNDVDQLVWYNRLLYFLGDDDDGVMGILTSFALQFPINLLAFEGMFYFYLSSIHKESAADARAGDRGSNAVMTSALAKTAAHDLFFYENPFSGNYFRGEEPPARFATERAMAYREALVVHGQRWMTMLEQELPARNATHPNFRQRREALGGCEYNLIPAAHDDAYGLECWAVAAVCDKRRAEDDPAEYTRLRREHYLDHLEILQTYEAEGKLRTPEEMRPVVLAALSLGMPEKAEALCDAVIAANDNLLSTAFCRYWKGYLMAHRLDRGCLEYLYQAIDTNRNYIREGLDEIGQFCIRMGLEAELEEYRSRAPGYMQTEADWDNDSGITARSKLRPEQLPEGWLERICAYILQVSDGVVSHIYLVHETVGPGNECSAFILRFAEGTEDDRIDRIYERVFRLLDDWPEDWEFSLYIFEPAMEKVLAKVPGACVHPHD